MRHKIPTDSVEHGWGEKNPSLEDVFESMQSMAQQLVKQGEWPRPIYTDN